jgi:hypothetical protein
MARPPSPSTAYLASIGKAPDGTPADKEKAKAKAKRSPGKIAAAFIGILVLVTWCVMLTKSIWSISHTNLCPSTSGANEDDKVAAFACWVVEASDAWANTMGVWELIAGLVDSVPGGKAASKAQPGTVGGLALLVAPLLSQLGVSASVFVAPATVAWETGLSFVDDKALAALIALFVFPVAFFFLALPVGAFFTYKTIVSPFLTSSQDQSGLTPGGWTLAVFWALCAVANLLVSAVDMPEWGQALVWVSTLAGAGWTYVNV